MRDQEPIYKPQTVAGATAFGSLVLALFAFPYVLGAVAGVLAVLSGCLAVWLHLTDKS